MHKPHNKTTLFIIGVLVIAGVYIYSAYGENAQAATAPASSSALSSSSNSSPMGNIVNGNALGSNDQQINADTAFLASLTSLTKIKIDTTLFMNESFNALVDNNVKLEPTPSGRTNPFAPISGVTPTLTPQAGPVSTNPPLQITDKSANLYGTVNNQTGVTSVYFEYGPTATLGKKTIPASQSLVGTFVTNVTGLTPKTTYFYRASAKIGNNIVFGEIVTFVTN